MWCHGHKHKLFPCDILYELRELVTGHFIDQLISVIESFLFLFLDCTCCKAHCRIKLEAEVEVAAAAVKVLTTQLVDYNPITVVCFIHRWINDDNIGYSQPCSTCQQSTSCWGKVIHVCFLYPALIWSEMNAGNWSPKCSRLVNWGNLGCSCSSACLLR